MNAGSQFLIVIALTRGLDAATAGAILTATTLCLMIAGILRLDAGNGLIYFIARSHRRNRPPSTPPRPAHSTRPAHSIRSARSGPSTDCTDPIPSAEDHAKSGYIRVALAPVLGLSVLTALVVARYGDTLAAALMPGPTTAVLGSALRTLAVALPVIVCADVLVSATRGYGSMRPTALLGGVLQPAAQFVLVGLLTWSATAAGADGGGWTIPSDAIGWVIPAAWALPALPVLILSGIWLHRRALPGPYVPGTAVEFWRYTAPRALGGAVQAVFQRLDIVVVAMLAGPEQAALYTAATRFKVVGQLVNQGLAQAVQPRLVRAMAEGDLPLARRLYQTTTMWLVVLTWPVWLAYAALAPWLLQVFGTGYRDGAVVAAVLAGTMMLATACGMVDVVLIAAGRTASSMMNILGAIAVTVALDVVLVPVHGALGAALGWAGGVVAKNLLPLFQISRLYELRPFGAHSLPSLRPWRAEEAT
ncbi:lipopolysaccharide biosynthesis protein [Sphaerisporangium corydalis]|uniref:Lipopolysaccharide biosynthesis protein n=1 Tax=Sphaerisporangium corydalis TaxID=1441875 RepID=A0ABV9EF38_9ACTN|nr:lipopolysaccharide biosynthesis protein [Sphaerisporangium corydalis]